MVIVKVRHCPKVPFLMGKKQAESALQFSEGKKGRGGILSKKVEGSVWWKCHLSQGVKWAEGTLQFSEQNPCRILSKEKGGKKFKLKWGH